MVEHTGSKERVSVSWDPVFSLEGTPPLTQDLTLGLASKGFWHLSTVPSRRTGLWYPGPGDNSPHQQTWVERGTDTLAWIHTCSNLASSCLLWVCSVPRLRASSATPFFPFKIIWSLVSVVTLGTFSFGGPVTAWLLPSLGGDGVKDCGTNNLKGWDQRSRQKRRLHLQLWQIWFAVFYTNCLELFLRLRREIYYSTRLL